MLVVPLSAAVSACAALWGFQDAVDLPDANLDAPALDEADSTPGPVDSAAADAGEGDGAGADADGAGSPGDASGPGDGTAAQDAPALDLCAACAPALPGNGWSGPFEMFQIDSIVTADGAALEAGSAALPTCGQDDPAWDTAIDLHGLPVAPPAECSCACGSPSDAVCSTPTASYFDDAVCNKSCAGGSTSIGSACTPTEPPVAGCENAHLELSTELLDAGACGVEAGVVRPTMSWQVTARLCAPTPAIGSSAALGPVCEAGICVPATDPVFESGYCVIYAGTVACPEPGYPVRHTYADGGQPYYADSLDTRGCTACGCGPPAGVSCSLEAGTSTAIEAGVCVSPMPYAGCTNVGQETTFVTAAAAPVGGGCTTLAEGGVAFGSVEPTVPYTICCTQ